MNGFRDLPDTVCSGFGNLRKFADLWTPGGTTALCSASSGRLAWSCGSVQVWDSEDDCRDSALLTRFKPGRISEWK